MHWGKGILISIIIFLAGTAFMIVIAVNSPTDLVVKNYYEKGVKYQEQIDRINRTNALSEQADIKFTGRGLFIRLPKNFPPEKINGEVLFYRPSNAGEDWKVPLSVDSSGTVLISTDRLEKGFWKAELNWSSEGKDYFKETSFTIR
jgi:nitrogen fixation protein FixH